MKRTVLKTGDGSVTLHIPEWNEQYHSKHGAVAEAVHVFIKEGLHHWIAQHKASAVAILEIGFGTGLNALLTQLEAEKNNWKIAYTGVDAYPLGESDLEFLNFALMTHSPKALFQKLHSISWEESHVLTKHFSLTKQEKFFSEIQDQHAFDVIYFDAFGVRVQPDLWTEEIFEKMFQALRPKGILVTYAANGSARRALEAVGFQVERIPGPPGKKQMMRAVKDQ